MAATRTLPRSALPRTVVLATGTSVRLRAATADDVDAVARMHRRCSLETVFRRYFTAVPQMSPAVQQRLLATEVAVVAETAGEVVALAHLVASPGHPVELAVLVEDAWQRRGIGRVLAGHLLDAAESHGHREVVAYTLPSSTASHTLLRRAGEGRTAPRFVHGPDGLVTVTMTLEPATGSMTTTVPTAVPLTA